MNRSGAGGRWCGGRSSSNFELRVGRELERGARGLSRKWQGRTFHDLLYVPSGSLHYMAAQTDTLARTLAVLSLVTSAGSLGWQFINNRLTGHRGFAASSGRHESGVC